MDVDVGAGGKVAIDVEPEDAVSSSVPLLQPGFMVAAEFDRDKEPGDMKPGCAEGILVRFDRSTMCRLLLNSGGVVAGGFIGICLAGKGS